MLAAYDNTPPVAKAANAAYGAARNNTAPDAIVPASAKRPVTVRVICTTAIPDETWGSGAIGGLNPIDGVPVVVGPDGVRPGDAVLFTNRATGSGNGIWVVDHIQPTFRRPAAGELGYGVHLNGLQVTAREGTANRGKVYQLTTANPIVLDTTALTFAAQGTSGAAQAISP